MGLRLEVIFDHRLKRRRGQRGSQIQAPNVREFDCGFGCSWFCSSAMSLPYKVATLLYCFDREDRVLLIERTREPNVGLWSPPGGKVEVAEGESPYAAAQREAKEELGLSFPLSEVHLVGLISEHGYGGAAHWLMFLFEVKVKPERLPPVHAEGRFGFFQRGDLDALKLPNTDREKIWPLFWKHRGGFFAAHCQCTEEGNIWTMEESIGPA